MCNLQIKSGTYSMQGIFFCQLLSAIIESMLFFRLYPFWTHPALCELSTCVARRFPKTLQMTKDESLSQLMKLITAFTGGMWITWSTYLRQFNLAVLSIETKV